MSEMRWIGGIAAGLLLALTTTLAVAVAGGPSGKVDYDREVRPILAENCFLCHGPDPGSRKAGLRLDRASRAVVPGKPAQSALLARVNASSAALRMPPAEAKKTLTAAQRETLRRWVAQGGGYTRHWSLRPLPAQVAVPAVKNAAWPRHPLDRFILSRLEKEGLSPSPEATRADWLRRVSLDLTGLPPSLAEADAFFADKSSHAYETVVDRLLASPAFGEQMAVPWLDLARYGDSYGYQSDQLSPSWPYRDWVVKAFNVNLPYDRFLTEQLAGDLLPGATREQRLATAFNRMHRMTNEGGSVAEEWRLEYVADRVRTFGTAFLGLTLECARCHDHKYDPVTQRDFYAFSAFFDNVDEYGLYNQSDIVPTPTVLLPTPEQEKALTAAQGALTAAESDYVRTCREREAAFTAWLAGPRPSVLPDQTGWFDFEGFDGDKLRNAVPGAAAGARADDVPLVPGKVGKAAQLDGENNVHFPELGKFTRHTPFTIAFWLRDPRTLTEPVVVFHASSGTDVGFHGYDLLLENGQLSARLYRHWPGNAIGVRTRVAIPKGAWTHVALTYDGSSRASGLKIYVDGHLALSDILRDRLWKGTGQHTLAFGQRFRDRGFKGGQIDELAIFSRDLTALEIGQLFDGHALADALAQPATVTDALRAYYLSAIDPQSRASAQKRMAAREGLWRAEDPQLEVAAMEEMRPARATYVLARGRYDAPRSAANRVGRGVPESVRAFTAGLSRDRLGLARWLTLPDHPLTARVAVNRLWGQLFGRGLVETMEDFGIQGRLPSHPELLDWLARDFVASGWDTKRLIKRLVLSATYRQASALRPELKRRDPQNLLLARAPSYRLSAETIRDLALAASGLLDRRSGGPPVSPYQPGDLWRETNTMSPSYRQSVGTDLYRRSLYTVWKRTAPIPNMVAFDAAGREVCIARRQKTSTPLQALVLLNDPQFVEAARVLGERMVKEGGADDTLRARFAFRRVAVREPTAAEAALLEKLYAQQRAAFAADPTAAAKFVTVGESKVDPTLSVVEVAAAGTVAQAILNLDAAIWKR